MGEGSGGGGGCCTNWGDRTPGSQTPGVPATPSPRQRRTLRHRGLKNGHSRPCGRSAKNAAKCGKITPPQNLYILSMNKSEAPPGRAGTCRCEITATSTTAKVLRLRHLHSFLQYLNHEPLSLHNDGHETTCTTGASTTWQRTATGNLCGLLRSLDHGDLPLRNERDVDNFRWAATAGPPQFAAPWNHASVVAQHGRNDLPKNCTCGMSPDFCTVHTVGTTSPLHNKEVQHSVDELKLGRLQEHVRHGLLELVVESHRDVYNREERVGTRPSGAFSSSSFSFSSSSSPPFSPENHVPRHPAPREKRRSRPTPSAPPPSPSPLSSSSPPPPPSVSCGERTGGGT